MGEILKKSVIIIVLLFILGLFFRLYNFENSFLFNHDHDLYSWIAKDIVVSRHWRSVGQVTSVPGVFIGPFYYYLMALFYFLFQMNPLSAVIPLTLIGLAGIFSFYYLLKVYFGDKAGLIGSFLWACTWGVAHFERWSVPTQPTLLWSIWFLYVIFGMLKGKINKMLPIFSLLVGLTYHIHIALLPIVILPIIAYMFSAGKLKDKISKVDIKRIVMAVMFFLLVSSPFWIFEIKHNFSQTTSILEVNKMETGESVGWLKFDKVLMASGKEFQVRLVRGWDGFDGRVMWLVLVTLVFVLKKARKIKMKQLILMWGWILLILMAQYISKRKVSEYYFTNLVPIFMLCIALLLDVIYKKFGKLLLVGLLFLWLCFNTWGLISGSSVSNSYRQKKQLVEFIKNHATENNYPCIAVNYIADFGRGVGFRYLFWYKGMKLVKPGCGAPVYNIVIPYFTSQDEITAKFGRLGVILPEIKNFDDVMTCDNKANQIDALLGYTE